MSDDIPLEVRVRAFLVERFGLSLDTMPRALVNGLLGRLEGLDLHSPEALAVIESACSVGETMFLRHPHHFAMLREFAWTRPSHTLRIWSAGCASGEEAWSIAGVLHATGRRFEVVGTDMNPGAIERARRREYGLWSLRGVDPQSTPWLTVRGTSVEVDATLESRVRFEVGNLATSPMPADLDVLFCRNVLLYFDPTAAAEVLDRFHDAMAPGGLLFLGPFDHPPRDNRGWQLRDFDGVRVYEHVDPRAGKAGNLLDTLSEDSWSPTLPEPSSEPGAPPSTPPRARRRSRPLGHLPPEPTLIPEPRDEVEDKVDAARSLANAGEQARAMALLDGLIEDHPLAVEPVLLLAMIASEAGAVDVATRAARRACLLAPHSAMPNYLLGACFQAAGDSRQAAVRFRAARAALADLGPEDELPYGEGLTVAQLGQLIDRTSRSSA